MEETGRVRGLLANLTSQKTKSHCHRIVVELQTLSVKLLNRLFSIRLALVYDHGRSLK